MDHKSFLKTLTAADRQRLTETSDRAGLLHLAMHLAAITVTGIVMGTFFAMALPGWPLAMLLHGVLLVFLFTLLHETVHYTPFRSRWLNDCVGHFCGLVLLIPPVWFRYFHLAHHRHTHDPALDPELEEPHPETWAQYLLHVSGLPLWRSTIATLLRNAAGWHEDGFLPTRARARVALEARTMLACYVLIAAVSVAAGSVLVLTLWLGPLVLGQPFLRLYLLAEHARCPHVSNMFENTRTTLTGRLIRALAWNMPYHAEHHAMPTVPFHKLPELHSIVRPHLTSTADGYRAFHKDFTMSLNEGEAS
ncbi:MAG: fatty acid desaturase [Pseudomonadota bacterium]